MVENEEYLRATAVTLTSNKTQDSRAVNVPNTEADTLGVNDGGTRVVHDFDTDNRIIERRKDQMIRGMCTNFRQNNDFWGIFAVSVEDQMRTKIRISHVHARLLKRPLKEKSSSIIYYCNNKNIRLFKLYNLSFELVAKYFI